MKDGKPGRGAERTGSQALRALLGVRELVYSGDVAPGERLSEVTLSERLGLSRTPIRDALARLELEGLLERIPSGGYAARAFSHADVLDAIELRGVIEGAAIRLAAERGAAPAPLHSVKSLLRELDDIIAEGPEALDFRAYVNANAAFHERIAELAGSDLLRREAERVSRMPFAGASAFLNAQAELPEFRASLTIGQAQHHAMIEAVELREGARAEALAREHARLARRNLKLVIQDRDLMAKLPGMGLISG